MGKPTDRVYTIDVEEVNSLRQKLGMNMERLAEKAGVSVRTLRRWLKGQPAYLENVNALSKALGVTPCDLLCDDPDTPEA